MIKSTPKVGLLMAICAFVAVVLAVDTWVFISLIRFPSSYFLVKLILAPVLLVIAIIIAVKGYSSAITVWISNNKVGYKYPLSSPKKHPIKNIQNWQEDVVERKDSKYKRVTIQFTDGKKLQLSNQENGNYDKIINYLKKKVKMAS